MPSRIYMLPLAAAILALASGAAQAQEVVKIGVSGPLSGA
ncbi:MAG: branched-chain amino acid ABC transporter substrate-binding protein, partial [Telluria sp.]